MSRLKPTTVALRTLKRQQLPTRCRITSEQAIDLLEQLTGQDFGMDVETWSEWLRHNFVTGDHLAAAPECVGVIVGIKRGLECLVRLDEGKEIAALIPKQVARDMHWLPPGSRVRVRLLEPGCSQVTGFD